MKPILGFLLLVVVVVLTGGLYLAIRKPEQKVTDLATLKGLRITFAQRLQRLGRFLATLFTFVIAKAAHVTRKVRVSLSDKRNSVTEYTQG
ncbi:MAG: hypothetical protein ROO76_13660 [Terriglobia bacterium]|nr:hypothetical protein [Terriglobia bacterium]